jgi:2'-5' RNA ligase
VPLLTADPAAFPAEPPGDLSDPAAIAAHDWAAYSALDEMTDHWSRPGWSDGSRGYYWMLTFPNAAALTRLALRCQEALAPLGLDPVPADGLHITLARVGAADSIDSGQLSGLVQAAEATLPAAFTLQAMPLAGSRGAVRLSVSPWEPLVRLHAALIQAGKNADITMKKPTTVFRPHLSLAYNNQRRAAAPVIDTVASLRCLPPVELGVADVQLVELRRCGTEYRWDVLKYVPLTAPDVACRRPVR